MKKLMKVMACILCIAMMMSLLAVLAFAAGDEETGETGSTETAALPVSLINPNEKGSITINKYEGSNTDVPLAGVEFTIYKVATIVQSETSPIGVTLTPVSALPSNFTFESTTTAAEVVAALTGNGEAAKLETLGEGTAITTGENGQAKFENLDLGVYLVLETKAPPQIVNKTANFLVSVPMTNATGDAWVYDIEAQPKNAATRGDAALKKFGKVGNVETVLKDAVFELYMEIDGKWEKLEKNSAGEDITAKLKTDENGLIQVGGLAPGKYYFKEADLPDDSGYIMDDVTTYEFTIESVVDEAGNTTARVNYGGQEIFEDGTLVALKIINEKPVMNKEVLKKDGVTWGNETSAAYGETVEYRITVDVPNGINNLVEFFLSDTMQHQTYTDGTLVVDLPGDRPDLTQATLGDAFTWDPDTKIWTINFNDPVLAEDEETVVEINSLLSGCGGQQIVVSFETTTDESAVIAPGRNDNDAELKYTNEWTTGGDPLPPAPSEDVITDEVTVFTFSIQILKTDDSDEPKPLKDAVFDLYEQVAAGTEGAVSLPGLEGDYLMVRSDLKTDENGKKVVPGLDEGDYWLVETKAPVDPVTGESYNLLRDPVKVTLAVEYRVTTKTDTRYDAEGGIVYTETVITEEYFENDATEPLFLSQVTTVVNKKGFELPVTGGMGTFMFALVGGAMILCGVSILFRDKKKYV